MAIKDTQTQRLYIDQTHKSQFIKFKVLHNKKNHKSYILKTDRSWTSARDNDLTLAEHVIVQQNADVIQIGETVRTKGCGSYARKKLKGLNMPTLSSVLRSRDTKAGGYIKQPCSG